MEDKEYPIAKFKAALIAMLTDFRSEGCGDPKCKVCAASKAAEKLAEEALAEIEALQTK
jgi:hypothetical protein